MIKTVLMVYFASHNKSNELATQQQQQQKNAFNDSLFPDLSVNNNKMACV